MPDDYNSKTAIAIAALSAVAGIFWLAAQKVDKIQRDLADSARHRGYPVNRWLAAYYESPQYRTMLAAGFWAGFGLSLIAALAVFCTNWMPARLNGVSPP